MITTARDIERALDAIGNPVRRQILRLVATTPLPVGSIAARFDISRPAISRHVAVLHRAGLVRPSIAGKRNLYELDETGLALVRQWLDNIGRIAAAASPARESGPEE